MSKIVEIYRGLMLNRRLGYCTEGAWAGWLFALHPDGQWVSIAKLDAALRAVGVAEQWRPIETAPRNLKILAWFPTFRTADTCVLDDLQYMTDKPTYWQPLPAPAEVRTLSDESLRSATTYAAPKGDQHDSTKEKP